MNIARPFKDAWYLGYKLPETRPAARNDLSTTGTSLPNTAIDLPAIEAALIARLTALSATRTALKAIGLAWPATGMALPTVQWRPRRLQGRLCQLQRQLCQWQRLVCQLCTSIVLQAMMTLYSNMYRPYSSCVITRSSSLSITELLQSGQFDHYHTHWVCKFEQKPLEKS